MNCQDFIEHYDKDEELKHHLGLSYAQIDKMRDNLQREYAEKCFAPPAFKFPYLTLTLAAFIFGILIGMFI